MGDRFGTEAGAVLSHGIFVFAHFLRAGHDHFTKQHQDYSKGFDFLLKLVIHAAGRRIEMELVINHMPLLTTRACE
jgi:hypothetical protein